MSEPYTPTTEEVRAEFVTNKALRMPTTWSGAAEFDAWLSEHDRQVAERAWRDGYYAGKRDYAGSITGGLSISTPNPHAKGEQSNG